MESLETISLPPTPPRISIIVPTYNAVSYLPQALDSIFTQNYDDYEVIVVDDGSTDETCQVMKRYKERVHYVYQENAGSAAARNRGLALARGEFVVFLDADDLLLPGKLRQQAAFLQLRPDLGMVHSGWIIIDKEGNEVRQVAPWQWAPQLDIDTWIRYKPIRMGAMMFRRAWIESVGGFDDTFRQAQDMDLILRLVLAGCQAEWVYRPTLSYRVYLESTIRRDPHVQYRCAIGVLDKFFAHPRVPARLQQREDTLRYHTYTWLAWHFYQCEQESEMALPLQQAFHHSPRPPEETALELVTVLFLWHEEHQMPAADKARLWARVAATLRTVSPQSDHVERLVAWGIQYRQAQGLRSLSFLKDLWPQYAHILTLKDGATFPFERFFEWSLLVWSGYVRPDGGETAVSHQTTARQYSAEELVDFAQLGLILQAEQVDLPILDRYCRDLGTHAGGSAYDKTRLYLTFLGQNLLGQRRDRARRGLQRALRLSLHPAAWLAWVHFIANAVRYWAK